MIDEHCGKKGTMLDYPDSFSLQKIEANSKYMGHLEKGRLTNFALSRDLFLSIVSSLFANIDYADVTFSELLISAKVNDTLHGIDGQKRRSLTRLLIELVSIC